MKTIFLFLFISLLSFSAQSQADSDIAKVVSYNILNYRNSFGQCNNSNNSANDKEANLAVIMENMDADIVCFHEVGSSSLTNVLNLLENTLNVNGVTKYEIADTRSNSSLRNAVFFNSELFSHYSSEQIREDLSGQSIVRLIDVVTFYHNDPTLDNSLDTTFLTVFAAHLKAGNSTADENERARATATIMDYLDKNPDIDNYLLAGDLNVYTSNGPAFTNLTSGEKRFLDPVNALGEWNNSAAFSLVHTQSTRSSQTNGGCFSGGGMDDRFDFVLISESIQTGENRISYINGSYEAFGQDGRRFNGSLTSPSNISKPSAVIDALYEVSDHLPVVMAVELAYSQPLAIDPQTIPTMNLIVREQNNSIILLNKDVRDFIGEIRIIDLTGRTIYQNGNSHISARGEYTPVVTLKSGIYILHAIDQSNLSKTVRFFKN